MTRSDEPLHIKTCPECHALTAADCLPEHLRWHLTEVRLQKRRKPKRWTMEMVPSTQGVTA